MRKATLVLLALGLVVATTAYASNPVRISQVYGSGSKDAANGYKCDYVELFNNSGAPVDIGGWSVQYKSSTGNFAHQGPEGTATTHRYALIPAGSVIPACGYFLVTGYCGAVGLDLPTSDAPNPGPGNQLNMAGNYGAVALFSDQVLNRSCVQAQAVAVDLVGYGAASTCFEISPAVPDGGDNLLFVRKQGGAQDTDNNSADFTTVAQVASVPSPVVHNSASPRNPDCIVPVGACCLPPLPDGCIIVSSVQCGLMGGVYLGNWAPCVPNPCVTPAKGTSWGQIKTMYK
jgi:hypothetical protein